MKKCDVYLRISIRSYLDTLVDHLITPVLSRPERAALALTQLDSGRALDSLDRLPHRNCIAASINVLIHEHGVLGLKARLEYQLDRLYEAEHGELPGPRFYLCSDGAP